MKSILLLGALALLTSTSALASSFAGTSGGASSASSAGTTGSSSGNNKIVERAREDAAGFVASDGRIRTARLEAALRHLRGQDPAAQARDDLALARAILAY